MKLIIDIPKEDYKTLSKMSEKEKVNELSYFEKIIANGKPYEERPQGEWIDRSEEGYVECPICGCLTNCEDNIDELNYCWNCGAKMQNSDAEK